MSWLLADGEQLQVTLSRFFQQKRENLLFRSSHQDEERMRVGKVLPFLRLSLEKGVQPHHR